MRIPPPGHSAEFACFKYHEVEREFHFWRWNFGHDSRYLPVKAHNANDLRPVMCNWKPDEPLDITWDHISHLYATQRAFNGTLVPSAATDVYKKWACLGPHMISVLHNRIVPARKIEGEAPRRPPAPKMRPCVRWSSDMSADHFVYDLVCMRYHEVKHELHFWMWNSQRKDRGRVGYSKAYKPVRPYGPIQQ